MDVFIIVILLNMYCLPAILLFVVQQISKYIFPLSAHLISWTSMIIVIIIYSQLCISAKPYQNFQKEFHKHFLRDVALNVAYIWNGINFAHCFYNLQWIVKRYKTSIRF